MTKFYFDTENYLLFDTKFYFQKYSHDKIISISIYLASKNHPLEFSIYTCCQCYRHVDVKIVQRMHAQGIR